MRNFRVRLSAATVVMLLAAQVGMAQGKSGQAGSVAGDIPTIQVTSKLVFLDVTVVDKRGHPVVTGLTKDDFQITENRAPQRIFSFEAPDAHALSASGDNADGKAPVTILVLDQLNSSFQDFAYIRWEAKRYLQSQPKELRSPTELMVVGNQTLELVQSYTRDRDELVNALVHLPTALPYKMMNGAFWTERLGQSFDALVQIALQSEGVPGRKNILWVGHGGPGVNTVVLPASIARAIAQYAHTITNMLVDARISLFVMYPGLPVGARVPLMGSAADADADIGDGDLFATTGDINFGVFVDETGGKLFYNRNDVDTEMREAQQMGSEYYTLTYQPHGGDDNGRFRRVRVTLRNPNLRAVTKIGYYAPDKNAPEDPRMRMMRSIASAARATVPFTALALRVDGVVRHPDTQTAEITVQMDPKELQWLPAEGGKSSTNVMMASATLTGRRDILTSRVQSMTVMANTQNASLLAEGPPIAVPFTVRLSKKTQSVRVIAETETGGRIGTAEVNRARIDAAPAVATPPPVLQPRVGVTPAATPQTAVPPAPPPQ
jgi:VWFA-related protein